MVIRLPNILLFFEFVIAFMNFNVHNWFIFIQAS